MFSPSEESDYVDALVEARQGLVLREVIASEHETNNAAIEVLSQKPSDICSLLIEQLVYIYRISGL